MRLLIHHCSCCGAAGLNWVARLLWICSYGLFSLIFLSSRIWWWRLCRAWILFCAHFRGPAEGGTPQGLRVNPLRGGEPQAVTVDPLRGGGVAPQALRVDPLRGGAPGTKGGPAEGGRPRD